MLVLEVDKLDKLASLVAQAWNFQGVRQKPHNWKVLHYVLREGSGQDGTAEADVANDSTGTAAASALLFACTYFRLLVYMPPYHGHKCVVSHSRLCELRGKRSAASFPIFS